MRLKFILIMLANILKLTAISALGGGYYYLTLNKISLKNTYLQSLFVFVQTHVFHYWSSDRNILSLYLKLYSNSISSKKIRI